MCICCHCIVCINSVCTAICIDLANVIVFNQTRSFSSDEQRDIDKADFCAESYKKNSSATSLKIEAQYKVIFKTNIDGTQEQIQIAQSKQCDNKFGDHWRKQILSDDARLASIKALQTIDECMRLNSDGLVPRMTISNSEFSLSLLWNPSQNVDVKIVQAGPRNFSDMEGCNASVKSSAQSELNFRAIKSANDVKTTLKPKETFLLQCQRKKLPPKTVDGETMNCYRDHLIGIATSAQSVTLSLPEKCVPSMPGARAAKLEKRLDDAERELKARSSALEALEKEVALHAKATETRLQENTKFVDVTPARLAELSENKCSAPGNTLDCVAAVNKACGDKYKGGVIQNWANSNVPVLCIGNKQPRAKSAGY